MNLQILDNRVMIWSGLILIVAMQRTGLALRQFFSMFRPKSSAQVNEALKIRELFGEVEDCSGSQSNILLQMDKKLKEKKVQEIEENQRVRNYLYYEYYRGEDYIQKLPYAGAYTLQDKANGIKQRKRKGIQDLRPITNHIERARLVREKTHAYHDKQRKYQMEQFERHLRRYPGTTKGPNPEDDWEAYREYGAKKMPKILMDQIQYEMALKRLRSGRRESMDMQPRIHAPSSLLSYMGTDRTLLGDTKTRQQTQQQEDSRTTQDTETPDSTQIIEMGRTEVPILPTMHFENYQDFMSHWMSWINFRNHYISHNIVTNMKKLQERCLQLCRTMNGNPAVEYVDLPCNIPSLYRYYKCLPKSLQDHPGLKDIYLGLEYKSPDFTYEVKEDGLNYTCPLLLPFDDISTRVLTDYTANSRHYATPFMYEKMFTISPEFTWDLHLFLDQIRKQELRGQATNQNKDARFPEPPEVHKMWEEGAPNLPVGYYSNDDGFWDSIISERLKRYDQCKPMLKTRKHFTH